jgi:hypothetical protein
MKCFLLTWGVGRPTHHTDINDIAHRQRTILRYLDISEDVESWLSSTGTIFIASNASQRSLAEKLRQRFPGINFLLVPVDIDTTAGWTDKVTWEFIRKPRHSPLSYEEAARLLEEYGCTPLDKAPSKWWHSPIIGDFLVDIESGHVDEAQLRLIEADLQRQRKIGVMP